MSQPFSLKNPHAHDINNPSANAALSEVLHARLSRRQLLRGTAAATLSATALPATSAASQPQRAAQLGFAPIATSSDDRVRVPAGYSARVLYRWGDPTGIAAAPQPAFAPRAANTAAEQALQAGMHHDGMAFFPFNAKNPHHGLLAMNHEYVDNGLLFPDGTRNWNMEKIRKSQNAMGISIIEVRQDNQKNWQVIRPSSYARRITPATPMHITGPARGHHLMQTRADPRGQLILGTMQNCANGQTPWGTYLTCEENWSDIFTRPSGKITNDEKRYGIKNSENEYLWSELDQRFNCDANPHEPNRFGWVVEIDPFSAQSTPRKHTWLGRFKHEGACLTITPSGRVAVYMGDDQRFEYIYKFVSRKKYQKGNREHNMQLLSDGMLYVARFDENGRGQWLALEHGKNGLTPENGFADQGEVLIKTRQAADLLGATKMDRPEWIAADPFAPGSLYCTLTNNNQRGQNGKPAPDAANPREDNRFGHIIHWVEDNQDGASLGFQWDILVLAGNHQSSKAEHRGNMSGDDFGSPDGLAFDYRGVLWIQTDVSASTLNRKEYAGMGNNQMLATIIGSNEYRRFLTAPKGAEVTGIAFTPDNKTLFVNIQHPGEPDEGASDPDNALAISHWPDGENATRPRAATVVITRDDGGIIGT